MKKYTLSFFVIITFGVYTLYQHLAGTDTAGVVGMTYTTPTTQTPDNASVTIPASPAPSPVKATKPAPVIVTKPKPVNTGLYKDGQYTGPSVDAYYGNIQVAATISGGKLTDVQFLDYPQDRGTSIRINTQAMPYLRQEAIRAQGANVNIISGATDSSGAFRQSLGVALAQARNV